MSPTEQSILRSSVLGAAVHGFLAVAAGAFAAHGFDPSSRAHELLATGARYQAMHALALLALWSLPFSACSRLRTARLFHAGIVIFAGTLYALAFGGPRWLGAVTPIGGSLLLLGWLSIAVTALQQSKATPT